MSKTSKTNKSSTTHKRHGLHQRRSKKFHAVYLPYLPLLISVLASIFISGFTPQRGTLAYATNMSINGLLQSTNSQRADKGQLSLAINQKLISAAQAKANDMAARNYWSHNTPGGEEPWIFVNNAGYKYVKAGENLAYGFATSDDAVIGWMNSTSHRENMLDPTFTEVGFGFANSSDFNNSGAETIVVAMYGKPQTLAEVAVQPTAPAQTSPSQPQTNSPPAPTTTPTEEQPAPAAPEAPSKEDTESTPAYNTNVTTEPTSQAVARVQTITDGKAPWAVLFVGAVIGGAIALMLMKHGLAVRRLLRNSEDFVLHHPLLDSTLIGIIILGLTLIRTVGVIR